MALDFTPILIWWLVILVFGLVGWPLAFSLLRWLPDRGFALARPVGLLTTGYVLWLGGSFRLLQNNLGGVLLALALVLALGVLWQRQQSRSGESLLAWLRREWRYALTIELLFALAFVAWAVFKAYNPNIETAGGEKWMEIAFINGVLRSDNFPPQDPWLSGFAISYYYFGYVLMAMATRLSGLVSTVAFNLYIPTLFAMTLAAACGIVANLVSLYQNGEWRIPQGYDVANSNLSPTSQSQITNYQLPTLGLSAILTGLLAALFVAILGNLEGLLEVLHKGALLPAGFWTWLDIRDLKVPPTGPGESWIPDRFIWWWRGSRVLTDYTLTGQEQEVIDEFPFFSFLLGDVHPHVLGLPFVLLVVSLGLNVIGNWLGINGDWLLVNSNSISTRNKQSITNPQLPREASNLHFSAVASQRSAVLEEILQNSWSSLLQAVGGRLAFGLYALYLGSLSFLNTWDFPIYLSVVGLALIAWHYNNKDEIRRMKDESFRLPPALRASASAFILSAIVGTLLLAVAGVLLYLPFYATFQSQARGILPNLWNPTRLPQFVVFFGPFLWAAGGLLLTLSRRRRGWQTYLGSTLLVTILGPVLLMLLALSALLFSPAGREYIQGILNNPGVQQILGDASIAALVQASLWRRLTNPWTFIFVGGLLGWALALFIGGLEEARTGGLEGWKVGQEEAEEQGSRESGQPSAAGGRTAAEQFALILVLVGLVLPLAVEFVYLRDNFGIRMNTIFKFYFQAWVLLALASAFAVYYVSQQARGIAALAWQAGVLLLLLAGMGYPVLAVPNKADFFQNAPRLDGMAWIAEYRPGDYAAIQWLRRHAPKGAVILEAPGAQYAAYQYTSRMSAMTGIPTLLGWGGHQSQWRGNYDEPARREPDIDRLYNTPDIAQAQRLLDKYGVTYVVVGALERERYSPPGLDKFARFMDVAFQQDEVIIYQRR